MPFITSKVNVPLSLQQQEQLKSGLGKAIECVPGKSEASLMIEFEAGCSFYLRGDNSHSMAHVTVAMFGNPDHLGYEHLSLAIARLFHRTLGIDPTRIYIKYEDIPAWSVAGQLFTAASGRP